MRRSALVLVGLGFTLPAALAPAQGQPRADAKRQSYEGLWGADLAACRDEDGVNRMLIEGNRFYWYETRCRARQIKAESRRSWTLRMSCEGEGRRYRARPRLSLATPDKLIMDDAPVGPTRRQLYVRCAGR